MCVTVLHGTAEAPARVALRTGSELPPGEVAEVQLRLRRRVSAAAGDRLIVRLTRLPAALDDLADPGVETDDPRTAILQAVGSRWSDDALNRIAHRYRTYTDRPATESTRA